LGIKQKKKERKCWFKGKKEKADGNIKNLGSKRDLGMRLWKAALFLGILSMTKSHFSF